ncbi:MAG: hypothetical protein HY400_00225 [Elusimicrobia bacterium]|nr:hypothetical protein [Elusimicrobiota bacterium]
MGHYLDILYDFFEFPDYAAQRVQEIKPVGLGLLAYGVAGGSLFLAQALSDRFLFLDPSMPLFIVTCLGQLACGFFLTAALHLLTEVSGGQGSAVGLFILFGLSDLVWALAVPLCLILGLFLPVRGWIFSVLFMFLGFANFYLKARSIHDNYGVSSGKAWMLLSLPYLFVLGIPVLLFGWMFWRIFF